MASIVRDQNRSLFQYGDRNEQVSFCAWKASNSSSRRFSSGVRGSACQAWSRALIRRFASEAELAEADLDSEDSGRNVTMTRASSTPGGASCSSMRPPRKMPSTVVNIASLLSSDREPGIEPGRVSGSRSMAGSHGHSTAPGQGSHRGGGILAVVKRQQKRGGLGSLRVGRDPGASGPRRRIAKTSPRTHEPGKAWGEPGEAFPRLYRGLSQCGDRSCGSGRPANEQEEGHIRWGEERTCRGERRTRLEEASPHPEEVPPVSGARRPGRLSGRTVRLVR
jgi:hypothetical protein